MKLNKGPHKGVPYLVIDFFILKNSKIGNLVFPIFMHKMTNFR